jgi:dTMP kinase
LKGKLIVIEGLDASGKQTQTKLVTEKLKEMNYNVMQVSFPDYESNSSALVKMYLNGELSDDPDAISPYAASSFYAVDRYASYIKGWGEFYNNGGIIVADRYTTSNMIHQASKIDVVRAKNLYLDWLFDYEYKLLKLPSPNKVVFLDMPPEYAKKLMAERLNKITGKESKDIHESNQNYLVKSYENALYVSNKFKWDHIYCVEDNVVRSIESINDEIMTNIMRDVFRKKYVKKQG